MENCNIVILTGAGISKESGLSTFRDAGGIWSRVNVEDVATPEGYLRNPQMVQDFYNERRQRLVKGGVEPNAAHVALARLEAQWPGQVLIVTQNIDDLHERGGSGTVLHMHGELLKVRCTGCNLVRSWRTDIVSDQVCDRCGAVGCFRPHVVWFGEMPLGLETIYSALDGCGLFISIGTSGSVQPAAGFIDYVRRNNGARTVELNLEPSHGATGFDHTRYGQASLIVPQYVDMILQAE